MFLKVDVWLLTGVVGRGGGGSLCPYPSSEGWRGVVCVLTSVVRRRGGVLARIALRQAGGGGVVHALA